MTEIDSCALQFRANDPALHTMVGERLADVIRIKADSGFALFGPYIALLAGPCLARVTFQGPGRGQLVMDLSARNGETVLASHVVDLSALENGTAELLTVLPHPQEGCEVRLHCASEVSADILAVDIIVGQDALEGSVALSGGLRAGRSGAPATIPPRAPSMADTILAI